MADRWTAFDWADYAERELERVCDCEIPWDRALMVDLFSAAMDQAHDEAIEEASGLCNDAADAEMHAGGPMVMIAVGAYESAAADIDAALRKKPAQDPAS